MMQTNSALTLEALTKGLHSGDLLVDALVYEPKGSPNWNWLVESGNAVYFTFDLPAEDRAFLSGESDRRAVGFSPEQQMLTRQALNYIDQLTGLQHIEVPQSDGANLYFAAKNLIEETTAGIVLSQWSYSVGGEEDLIEDLSLRQFLYLDQAEKVLDLTPGGQGYETLLHELGHTLGLVHPHENIELPASLDSTQNTIMSYNFSGGPYTNFQALDLLALEFLYGSDGIGGQTYTDSVAYIGVNEASASERKGLLKIREADSTSQVFQGAGQWVDMVRFSDQLSAYKVMTSESNPGFIQVQSLSVGPASTYLYNIERLAFTDYVIAFDFQPGQTAYNAAMSVAAFFGSQFLDDFLPTALELFDSGLSVREVSSLVEQTQLIPLFYPEAQTTEGWVSVLYQNVMGEAINLETRRFLTDALQGELTRVDLLTQVVELGLVEPRVDLVAYQTQGFVFPIDAL
jgi:serralysin